MNNVVGQTAKGNTPFVGTRDYWLDNIKGVLLILVVVGHMTASLRDYYPDIKLLYNCINTFHMCAFLIITGYLSKRRIDQKDYISVINKNVIPYGLAQLLIYVFISLVPNGYKAASVSGTFSAKYFTFTVPIYQLWYLAALIIFMIICIKLQPKRHPVIFFVSAFVLSLVSGYLTQITVFRFSKAIGYFPFFLIGYFFPKNGMEFIRKKLWLCIPAIAIFVGLLYWLNLPGSSAISDLYGFSRAYEKFSHVYANFPPVLARALFLTIVPIISFAFFSLVPRRKTIFTKLGQRSMYIFVLHIIPLVLLRSINYKTKFLSDLDERYMRVLFVILCIAITFVLASNIVYKIFRPLLEPKFDIRTAVGDLYERHKKLKEK